MIFFRIVFMTAKAASERAIYLSRSERRIGGRRFPRFSGPNGVEISFPGESAAARSPGRIGDNAELERIYRRWREWSALMERLDYMIALFHMDSRRRERVIPNNYTVYPGGSLALV